MSIFKKDKEVEVVEDNKLAILEEEQTNNKAKMTIDEYINQRNKYLNNYSKMNYKTILISLLAFLALVIIYFLTSLVLKIYEINKYAGYGSIVVAVLFFILFYIVPVCKFSKQRKFSLEFGRNGLKLAKSTNKAICLEIRDRMIDLEDNVYCDMGETEYNILRNATKDNIEDALFNTYNTTIKKKAKKIISKYSKKCALLTALSQDKNVDSLIIASYDIALIKELTYLYGFRPNDKKMTTIILKVLRNVVISMGLTDLTSFFATEISSIATSAIPVFGSVIAKIIECAGQGFVNGILVNNLGNEIIKYLLNDYDLQYKLSLTEIFDSNKKDVNSLELSDSEMIELNEQSKKCSEELKQECENVVKNKK